VSKTIYLLTNHLKIMKRRTFLQFTGTLSIVGTAGCLDSATDSPESVVEEYYYIVNDVEKREDIDDAIEDIDSITHSTSPLVDMLEPDEEGTANVDSISIDNVENEITEQNLSQEEIQNEGGFFLEEDSITEISGQNNAVVEAIIEQSGENVEENTRTRTWLVAKEDGDWLIVF